MSEFWPSINPRIAQWFLTQYGHPTDIQSQGWQAISKGDHVLISAPTGTGKTLAAFMYVLNQLLVSVTPRPKVLYISPLKALNSDVFRNLQEPLEAIRAQDLEQEFSSVTLGIRSGDTSNSQRQKLLRHPPDILVTTPETLHIMLTSERGRQALRGITTLILDEIHVLVGSKRGTLTALSIERLEAMNPGIQRIGLSATLEPKDLAGKFLVGPEREFTLVTSQHTKTYDLEILLNDTNQSSWWDRQVPLVLEEIKNHKTTLIFCNSRRTAEKLAHRVNEAAEEQILYAHHGSLSKEYRQWVEEQLKAGILRGVVATGTLELGIDIGSVDRVLLIQAPFSISSAIQRVGRAGHQVGAVSKAAFVPLHPRDILAAAALIPWIHQGVTEPIQVPDAPLDVLAQMIMSEVAGRRTDPYKIYTLVRQTWSYRNVSSKDFLSVLSLLAGRYQTTNIAELKSRIVLGPTRLIEQNETTEPTETTEPARPIEPSNSTKTQEKQIDIRSEFDGDFNQQVTKATSDGTILPFPQWIEGGSSLSLLIYQSGGTIPDRGYYDLRIQGSGDKLGELDEEFVFERFLGDRFTLGNRIWKIESIDHQTVKVNPSTTAGMIVPFWRADALGIGDFYAKGVLKVLEQLDQDPEGSWISQLGTKSVQAELVSYGRRHREVTGVGLPTANHVVVEFLQDPSITPSLNHLIIHNFWGSRVNGPLCFYLRQKYLRDRGVTVSGLYTDDAVVLSLPEDHPPWDPFANLLPEDLELDLQQIIPGSGIFGARFRENAGRALLVLKKGFGKRTPLWVHRMKARDLLARVAKESDFPLIKETWKSLVHQDFDLPGLAHWLENMDNGMIQVSTVTTTHPSPLAGDLLWLLNNEYLYADDSQPEQLVYGAFSDSDNTPVPAIPEQVIKGFLDKYRQLLPDYLPETDFEWAQYFQDRRILQAIEVQEILRAIGQTSYDPQRCLETLGTYGFWMEPGPENTTNSELGTEHHWTFIRDQILWDELFSENPLENLNQLWWVHRSLFSEFDLIGDSGNQELLVNRGHSITHGDATIYNPKVLNLDEMFLEWSRWQGWILLRTLGDFGLHQVPDGFLQDQQTSHQDHLSSFQHEQLGFQNYPQRIISKEILESILRYWKRERRNQLPPLNLNQLRWLSVDLHGLIPLGSPEGSHKSSSRGIDSQTLLSRLSGYPLGISQLFHGVIQSRLPGVTGSNLNQQFFEQDYLWKGLGSETIVWFHAGDSDLYTSPTTPATSQPDPLESLLGSTPGARYPFQVIAKHLALDTQACHQTLWNAVRKGTVVGDSFLSLEQAFRNGWFKTSGTQQAKSHQDGPKTLPRLNRRFHSEWTTKFQTHGNWLINPPQGIDSESGVNLADQEDQAYRIIAQLFDRYPVVNRSLLMAEIDQVSWAKLLPYLRRLELAGELIGGQVCEELGGLQFITKEMAQVLSSTNQETPKKEESHGPWYWCHPGDPVAFVGPLAQVTRRTGEQWLLFQTSYGTDCNKIGQSDSSPQTEGTIDDHCAIIPELIPKIFIRSGGKQVDLFNQPQDFEESAEILVEFFRTQYFAFPWAKNKVEIREIGGINAMDHPLGQVLVTKGFVIQNQQLMLWKY
jgi:ATP-dependent Lhr-like helicase